MVPDKRLLTTPFYDLGDDSDSPPALRMLPRPARLIQNVDAEQKKKTTNTSPRTLPRDDC